MDCPKCALKDVEGPSCPRCGVAFAKLRVAPPLTEEPPLTYQVEEGTGSGSAKVALWFGLFAAAVVVLCLVVRPGQRRPAVATALPAAFSPRPPAAKQPPPS